MTALLVAAGLLCIVVSVVHGYLGETVIIGPATFPNRQARDLVRAVWQLSTLVWMGCGGVIALSPWLFAPANRSLAVVAACLPLLYGVVANAWITRGRHMGWKLLGTAVLLALLGASL